MTSGNVQVLSSTTLQCICVILAIKGLDAFYTLQTGGNNLADNGQPYHSRNQLINPDASNSSVCKEPNGQFSDPIYCDKYYDCWEGRPVSSGQCSHGLVFNEQTSSCDYPSMVNCEGKEIAQPLQDVDGGCEEPYGTFPNQNDCTQYTVCHAGRGIHFKCDEGLAYDEKLGVCAAPHDPTCLQQVSPPDEEVPELPLDPDSIKPAPPPPKPDGGGDGDIAFPIIPDLSSSIKCPMSASTGFIPIAKDCQSVLVCLNGIGYLFNCPKGEYYHAKEASCRPGKSDNCEQMNFSVARSATMNGHAVKYAYLKRGYPLLPKQYF